MGSRKGQDGPCGRLACPARAAGGGAMIPQARRQVSVWGDFSVSLRLALLRRAPCQQTAGTTRPGDEGHARHAGTIDGKPEPPARGRLRS